MESKENVTPENQKNRAQGENWTQEEKDLFLEIMRESAPIIDEILLAEEPAVQQIITVANVHSEEIDIKIPECSRKTQMVFPPKVDKEQNREKKNKLAGKEALLRSNIEFKERSSAMLEEEHKVKIKFQEQEITHHQLRHKLEIDILLQEKDKKKLELEL
ncbi:unnamed protein product [Parnassius apollo]|uniref:(apollo) hypothetical protein n=1 Tax=Parnassius apollo TaxID=110799 RepID=A0A8S3W4V6_PARAO|nr:unnamed protein product [Parnassius apollo]